MHVFALQQLNYLIENNNNKKNNQTINSSSFTSELYTALC